jgi:PAS domain S-box-containing protein
MPRETDATWLELMLRQAPAIIWTLDRELRFISGAGAGLTRLGLDPQQMRGVRLADFLGVADNTAPQMADHVRALAGEKVHYAGAWGGRRYDSYVEPLRRDGEIVGVIGIAIDVTEREEAADERRRAEVERERLVQESSSRRALLELVVENAQGGILLLRGPELRVEFANPAARAMAPGLQLVEGLRWYEDVVPELAAVTRTEVERVLKTGEASLVVDAPMTFRRYPDASPVTSYITSSRVPVRLPDGEPGVLIQFIDTTPKVLAGKEVERLAEASREQAARLEAILNNMVEGVTVIDSNGEISFLNRAAVELTGVSPEEVLHKPYVALLDRIDSRDFAGERSYVNSNVAERVFAGEAVIRETTILRRGGPRRATLRTTATPLRAPDGAFAGAVLVSRDVTETIEFERLKDQFIEVAAHELKTPVAIMKTNAQLLLECREPLSAQQSTMARAIDRGANRIHKIVQELLDISQLQLEKLTLKVVDVELVQLIHRVLHRLAPAASGRHVLRFDAAAPVFVLCDPHRFEWVVTHLMENAMQYSPDGGDVDIGLLSGDDNVTLSVHDHGVGIPLDRQQRIFDRFFRAHTGTPQDYGGLGVSLYISREIVHRSRGEMWFESVPGGGTTFYVRLLKGSAADGAGLGREGAPRR